MPESLLRRLFHLTVTEGVSRFGALAAVVLTARWLGANGYGVFAYGYAAGNIAATVTEAGLTSYVLREAAHRTSLLGGLVKTVAHVRTWLTLASVVVIGTLGYATTHSSIVVITAVLLGAALCIRWVGQTYVAAFLGFGNARVGLIQQTVERAVLIGILIAALLSTRPSAPIAAAAFLIAASVACVIGVVLWQRFWTTEESSLAQISFLGILTKVWPLAAGALGVALFLNTGPLLVGSLASQQEAGEYGAALGLYLPLVGLPAILMKAVIGDLAVGTPGPQAQQALSRLAYAAIVIPGTLVAAAPEITRVVLGGGFHHVDDVLLVLGFGAAASFLNSYFYYYGLARHLERLYTAAVGVAVLCFVALTPWLIVSWGGVGAALGLITAEITSLLVTAALTARAEGLRVRHMLRPAIPAVVPGFLTLLALTGVLLLTRQVQWHPVIRLGASILAACAVAATLYRRELAARGVA